MTTLYFYLDDERTPSDRKWIVVRDAKILWDLVIECEADMVVSLDHDLGDGYDTGYDFLNRLERELATNVGWVPDITFQIHSANPVGRANMERAIQSINRMLEQEK